MPFKEDKERADTAEEIKELEIKARAQSQGSDHWRRSAYECLKLLDDLNNKKLTLDQINWLIQKMKERFN